MGAARLRRSTEQAGKLLGGVVVHSAAYLNRVVDWRSFCLPRLAANYAGSVRRFLLERFESVNLILFEEQVFPGVSTEALLLLCEGNGGTDHFTVR